jgi:outer membrane receptor protein involved in Fe transport
MKLKYSWAALLTGTSLITIPGLASAQTAPQVLPQPAQAQPAEPQPEPQSAAPAEGSGDIVVTGSRIAANGNTMPTPVTVVSAQDLAVAKPTTLIDGLNTLPVFSGSRGQQSNPIGAGVAGAGSPASNQLNLRNLGASRTLVLFDGQRVAPTTIAGNVDADIIPQMLIQRVEVVTGGTSAVYGSDAVAGVVNFIPDRKFKGVKIEAQAGETQLADNKNWKIGIAAGASLFNDRVHIEGSYEHYDDRGVLDRWSRDWNNKYAVVGTGAASNPYILLANVRNNSASFGGLITNGVLKDQQFRSDGLLSAFQHGTPTSTATAEVGGDGYYQSASMVAPLKFDQMYFRADADIGASTHAHFQIARDKKSNSIGYLWPALTGMTMSRDNAFLPAAARAQLLGANQSTFTFGKILSQEPRLQPEITSDQVIMNGGLDGKIGGWKWDLSANYGKTTLHNNFLYNQNNQRLAAALDAVVNPANGQIVCASALTGQNPGCVPLNVFGPTSASKEALNYVFQTTHFTAHTETSDVNGTISGNLFDLGAGPISVALSGEWRKTSYDSETDADATTLANCAGIRFNCNSKTLLWANAFGNRSNVSVTVKEGAAEFEVPLLKDKWFAESFSLNGAVRYTSYSTAGDYWTWKVGADWHIDRSLRFRGTISRDIRAPTLNDLFAPATIQTSNALDQLTNTTASVPSYRAGNPSLLSEIGRTKTVGLVYQPEWLPHFSLAVDLFFITVKNAIVEVKGDDSVVQQACYASGGTSPYCALQTRPNNNYTDTSAANAVTGWFQYNINISEVRTRGMDVEANWAGEIFGKPVNFRGFLTWQPHTVYAQPGLSNVDMGGTAYGPTPLVASPAVRVTLNESINLTQEFRVDFQERYRDSLRLSGDDTLHVACCSVAPVAYVDVNLAYKVKTGFGDGEVFFNIQNLLDKNPPAAAPPGSTTPGAMGGWAIGDDPLGRSFVTGFRFKF